MKEERKGTLSTSDDIDLYELYLVVKKRFILIAGIVISAILITGAISFLMPPVYRSSLIVKIFTSETEKRPIISTGEVEEVISKLDRLVKEKQISELSNKLTIDGEQLKKVVKFDTKTTVEAKDIVEITVEVYDRELIPVLKNGIIHYLNQNPYVDERITMWKNNNLRQTAEIQEKIKEIDVLKSILISQIKKDGIKYLGFNPLQLDQEVLNLKKKIRDLQDSMMLLRGFEVTIEPEIPRKPARPKKIFNIAMAGIASLFLGISLAFFIEWVESNKYRTK
jgi:capsular polysaccharide biosynthesis protein